MITLAILSMGLAGQINSNPISPVDHQVTDEKFRLYWDDKLDGVGPRIAETGSSKETRFRDVQFSVQNPQFSGKFLDEKGSITGRVDFGDEPVRLVSFWTTYEGVTTSYQIVLGAAPFAGTWHDTKGRRGDCTLLKHQ